MGNLDDMLANAGLGGDADDYSAPEGFRSGFVSIVGRPNTGKSTLTNSLVGEKIAITANQPETTRHPVRGVVHRENCQIVVVDTPGLHKPRTLLGERLNDMVQETYSDVDLVAMVVPADEKIGPGDRWIYENVSKGCKNIMGIVSKVDKVSRDTIIERLIELQELLGPDAELVPLSSKSGENINTLIDVMASQLPEGPRLYPKGHITDEDLHTRMAELIREAALGGLRDELPHSVAVQIDEVLPNQDREGVLDVHAVIYVERSGQKSILMGRDGRRMGITIHKARKELIALLGQNVYLDLRVKVLKDWQSDPKQLGKLGF
ncbi:GTPase Era [Corynebacterium amycolatum]|nr:GTPase Era [Corynebacterium amycolatum]